MEEIQWLLTANQIKLMAKKYQQDQCTINRVTYNLLYYFSNGFSLRQLNKIIKIIQKNHLFVIIILTLMKPTIIVESKAHYQFTQLMQFDICSTAYAEQIKFQIRIVLSITAKLKFPYYITQSLLPKKLHPGNSHLTKTYTNIIQVIAGE